MRLTVGCQRPAWQIVLRLAASIIAALLSAISPALAQETTVSSVYSVFDLKRAVADQVQHIVVNSHLDLSNESAPSVANELWLLRLQDVQSIRGNCSDSPPGAPLEPPRTSETQCVISTSSNLLRTTNNLWIHDLYIEVKPPKDSATAATESVTPEVTILEVAGGDAWLTSSVLVGERSAITSRGVNVAGKGRMYARSSWFGFFKSQAYSAMRIGGGASAALQNCVFSSNKATGEQTGGAPTGGPVIGLVSEPAPSAVWLQGCSFVQNVSPENADVAAETEQCEVYSDVQFIPHVWNAQEGIPVSPQWLQTQLGRGGAAQATWGPPDGRSFLNEDSQTLVSLRQAQSLSSGLPNPTSRPLPPPTMLFAAPSQPIPDLEEEKTVWYERHVTLLAIGGSVIAAMLLFAAWLFFFRKMCCECCECAFCEERADDWETPVTEPTKSRIKTQRDVAQAHFLARFPGIARVRSIGSRTGTHVTASNASTVLTPKSQLSSVFTRTPLRPGATASTATPSYATPASPAIMEAVTVDSSTPEGGIRGPEVMGSPGAMPPHALGNSGDSSNPQPQSNNVPSLEGFHSPESNLQASPECPSYAEGTPAQPTPSELTAKPSNAAASAAAVGEIKENNTVSAPRKSASFGLPLTEDFASASKGNSARGSALLRSDAGEATHGVTPHLLHGADESAVLSQHAKHARGGEDDFKCFTPESAFLAGEENENESEAGKSPMERSPSEFATPKGQSPKRSSSKDDSPTGSSPTDSSRKGTSPQGISPKGRSKTIQSIAEGNPLAAGAVAEDDDRPSYSERFRKHKTQGGFVSIVPIRNKSLRKHGSRKGSISSTSGMALEQTQSQISATSADDREPLASSPVIAHALHASPEDTAQQEVAPAHRTQPVGPQRAGHISREQRPLQPTSPHQQQQQEQPEIQNVADKSTVVGVEVADTSTVPLLRGELIAPTSYLHQKWNKYNASFAEGMQGTTDGSAEHKEDNNFEVSDVVDSSINISPPPLRKSPSQQRTPLATDSPGNPTPSTAGQPPYPSPPGNPTQNGAPTGAKTALQAAATYDGSSSTARPQISSPMPSPGDTAVDATTASGAFPGSIDSDSRQSLQNDSLLICSDAPIVPNQPAASPAQTVSPMNTSGGNTTHNQQEQGSGSQGKLPAAASQGTEAVSHALNDLSVSDISSDQEVDRGVRDEAESTALETSEALGAPPLKRHTSLGVHPRLNRENVIKGSKLTAPPLSGSVSAGHVRVQSGARSTTESRITSGQAVNYGVNSSVKFKAGSDAAKSKFQGFKSTSQQEQPSFNEMASTVSGDSRVPSFPVVSPQSAIVSPSGDKVSNADGISTSSAPSGRASKASSRPPRNKSPASVIRNPLYPSFNSSVNSNLNSKLQSGFPLPSGSPASTTATSGTEATPTSPVTQEVVAPWVRGRHGFDLTKSSAPPTQPAEKYAKNRASLCGVNGSNASSVSPPCPAGPVVVHEGHALRSEGPKSGHRRNTSGGGGASGQESPTGGEQAAHLLLPAAPAQSRTSDTTPALSDAGTPVSGGGRSGPRRNFSSQWSNYNEEEDSSSTLPLTGPPLKGPGSTPSQQQLPKGNSSNSTQKSTQKSTQNLTPETVPNTPEGLPNSNDVEGASSAGAKSPPPQPSYATVWETPPHTNSGDLESNGAAKGGGSGSVGGAVLPHALQRSGSSQRWRSKFAQERGSPGRPPPGAPSTCDDPQLAASAGGSSLMHVMPSAHLDSTASHPPDSHELYAVSSGATGAGRTSLIASSTQIDDQEGAASAQVAAGPIKSVPVPQAIKMSLGVDTSNDVDSGGLGSSQNSLSSAPRSFDQSSSLARDRLRACIANPALPSSSKPDGNSASINSMPPALLVAALGSESPSKSPVATRVAAQGVSTGASGASGVSTGGMHLPAIAIPSAGTGATSEEGGSQGQLGRAYSPHHPQPGLARSHSSLKGAGGSGRMVSSPPPPPLVSSPHSALPPPPQRHRMEPAAGPAGISIGSNPNLPGAGPGLARSGSSRGLGGGVPQSPGGMSMASFFSEGAVSVLSDAAAGAQAQVALWIAEAETEGAWFTARYDLLEHQRTGSHGITNFAVSKGEASCGGGGMHDRALKFFADTSAFERIDALRAVPAVQPCMGAILESFSEASPDEGAGPLAEPLVPPCIVSMHLETLEERITRSPPDAATALTQLAGVASALTKLHDAGFVYHNVKPCDIAWSEDSASWELIDFGRCIPAGAESAVPLEVSTRWTPPEILKARDRKHETVTADTAADIWAFGIMGYELLTGNTAFPPGLPRGTIRRMLHGKAPLPWEDHANSSELTEELTDNEVKGLVLSCLARSPTIRPPAAALAATLQKLVRASRLSTSATPTRGDSTQLPLHASRHPERAALDADTGGTDSQNVPQHSGSGGFLREPLMHRMHEDSSAVATADSAAIEAAQSGEGLRVGPAGLAVSARPNIGMQYGDISACVTDTLDITQSREATQMISGELPAELRSDLSVTAAMW